MTASALAIYPALPPTGGFLLALGVPAVGLLLFSVALPWAGGIPWALAGLGIEYGIALHLRQGAAVDLSTVLYGAALLLVAELAYWSIASLPGSRLRREVVERRVLLMVVLLGGDVVLGLLLLLVTQIAAPGGLLWTVLGIAAAILVLSGVAALERRGGTWRS